MKMKKGFTLLEVLLVLAIISVLVSVAMVVSYTAYNKTRLTVTETRMTNLISAIIGNENLIETGGRVSFGYVGDTGQLPPTLPDLISNVSSVTGWNGPYIQAPIQQNPNSYETDGWGNLFQYDNTAGTITSAGPDGTFGDSDDITENIYNPIANLSNNNIRVYVYDSNNNILTDTYVSVSINLPSGPTSLSYNSAGYFEYTPLGSMSIGNYDVTATPTPGYPELGSAITSELSVYPKGSLTYSSTIIKFPNSLANIFTGADISFYRTTNATGINEWYSLPMTGAALTTFTLAKNILYAIPFICPKQITLDYIAIKVTSSAGGSKAELGIYNDTGNMYPGSLLLDAGAVSTASTGVQSLSINQTLQAGELYWLVVDDKSTPTITAVVPANVIDVLGVNNALTAPGHFYRVSNAFGALPATFPAGAAIWTGTNTPGVFVQLLQ